jgi:Domain of unknown function (DUF4041)/Meiotically up-regulated gene 113
MLQIIASVAGLLAVIVVLLLVLHVGVRKKLQRFKGIDDLEKYRGQCQKDADAAKAEQSTATSEAKHIHDTITTLKQEVAQYQQVVKDFKSAIELRRYVKQLATFAEGCRTLADLDSRIKDKKRHLDEQSVELTQLGYALNDAKGAGDIKVQITLAQNTLAALKTEIQSVEETGEMQQFGFYRAKYNFDSSERYMQQLDTIREQQKQMIKGKTAATCDTQWTVEGSAAQGRKMINDQIKLLLRAFNGECDAAVAKARYDNVVTLEKRMEKSFDQISKMGQVNRVSISRKYLELKLQELFLSHEFQEKKQEEKEEQRRIRDDMREQEKVEREIEKAKVDAEKDESVARNALDRARAELLAKAGQQTDKLEQLVSRLENELKEALDRKAKAIARAQLTKSGHVYILSNIGSFGEGIYKIGMTRRLEPLDRVRELGDASVPFLYDVHALIYSENAPELETKLHHHFASRRVNMINARREFYRVSLDEIREAVKHHFREVTFMTAPDAEQYRQTLSLLAETKSRQDANGAASSRETPTQLIA